MRCPRTSSARPGACGSVDSTDRLGALNARSHSTTRAALGCKGACKRERGMRGADIARRADHGDTPTGLAEMLQGLCNFGDRCRVRPRARNRRDSAAGIGISGSADCGSIAGAGAALGSRFSTDKIERRTGREAGSGAATSSSSGTSAGRRHARAALTEDFGRQHEGRHQERGREHGDQQDRQLLREGRHIGDAWRARSRALRRATHRYFRGRSTSR